MDERQFVSALYKAALLREPDERGLSAHVTALRRGQSPEQIASQFLRSGEFRSKLGRFVSLHPFDNAPPMPVDLDLTAEEEQALWARVARKWSDLGSSEPYWSVLTEPRWKVSRMTEAEILNAFYETGRAPMERLENWLARNRAPLPLTGICAEYGCGVGRCTIWLAKRFARVVAFDVSESHLRLAQARAEAEGLRNIEFVQVSCQQDLQRAAEVNLFYSVLVLQHNPPPLIITILKHLFGSLASGGIAYFQVPTHAPGYSFGLQEYLSRSVDDGIEMHFVPQHAVFGLASAHGMQPLEASPDGLIGNFGRWTSTTFLMVKRNSGTAPAPANC